ncbi:recombinase family protein [Solibacillus sp. FSL R7-0668]|uniref:recombinase family protein n=1 Tax=Solibacillus sp. FSL R7-0668 TaxID=2921688 RepID=UPI0030FAD751
MAQEIKARNVLCVAIYIRVSTKGQEDKYSLAAQEHELTLYAKSQKWTIVKIFKDVDSGAKFDKKGLNALLDCVDDGLVDIVLVADQDRLSRLDTIDWEILKDALRENKVKIAEPGTIINLENEDDEFLSDLKNILAKRERRKIRRRYMRGLRQYVREGGIYGRIPYEYLYNKQTKELSINEQFAWVIPFIDDLFLQGFGTSSIATELNKISRTPGGAKWHANTVYQRLRNPAYCGDYSVTFSNGETIVNKEKYPQLRTVETFERIKYLIETNTKPFPTTRKNHHPLARLHITCAECGRKIALQQGEKSQYGGYRWYLAHNFGLATPCPLDQKYNAVRITRPLVLAVKNILLSEDTAKNYLDIEFKDESQIALLEQKILNLQKMISDNNGKIDKLLDLYLDTKLTKDKYEEKVNSIETENKSLKVNYDEINTKIELMKAEKYSYDALIENLAVVEEHLSTIHRIDTEYSEKDKEDLIAALFENALLSPADNTITFKFTTFNNFPIDLTVAIDETNQEYEERLLQQQKERYNSTQAILDAQPTPISFMELKRLTGLNAQTLRLDEERFGTYRNMKLGKGSPERKAEIVKGIKRLISKNPNITSLDIAKELGSSQGTILKYIKENNLREGRQRKG